MTMDARYLDGGGINQLCLMPPQPLVLCAVRTEFSMVAACFGGTGQLLLLIMA